MNEQEKRLLLKDLCGRLPHGVMFRNENYDRDELLITISSENTDTIVSGSFIYDNIICSSFIEDFNIRPYLRPLSSMSENEIEEYFRQRRHDTIDVVNPKHQCSNSICAVVDGLYMRYWYEDLVVLNTLDWLNQHMFDYRNLIGKGLAIKAPQDMYNI